MSGSGRKFFAVFAVSLIAAAALLAAPAQSSQFLSPSAAVNAAGKKVTEPSAPSKTVADACLSLLQAAAPGVPNVSPQNVRPEAGPAAALGLIFGVRYALGPKEASTANTGLKSLSSGDVSGDRALLVAEYRRCRNEQLLNSL